MTPTEKQQFRAFLLNATPAELDQFAETVATVLKHKIKDVVRMCVEEEMRRAQEASA